jgi:site-specific recombinase
MNSGIFVLLGVTAVVLSWFIAVILTIRSRTKRWEARRSALKVVDFARPDRPGQEA